MCAMKNGANGNAKGGVATVAVMTPLASQWRYSAGIAIRADRRTIPTNSLQKIEAAILGVNNLLPLNGTTHSYRAVL
jgi:hypothetical protein